MRDEPRPHDGRFAGANTPTIGGSEPSTADAVFDALADGRRRTVVRHLFGRSEWVALEELADVVESPAAETGAATVDHHDRVRCRLYHSDLPKLDDAGIVDFDRETNRVRAAADDDRMDLCLDVMARAG